MLFIRIIYRTIILILIFSPAFAQSLPQNSSLPGSAGKNYPEIQDIQDNDAFEEYIRFEGKIIKQINVRVLDVSGPSVEENSNEDTSWLGNIGNSLHFKTRDWVVRNNLLFDEGDTINARKLSESERLLRSSGFFLDARIKIPDSTAERDSVIVDIVTQDKWTFGLLVSYDARSKNAMAGFRDYNFLGLGHVVEAAVTHDEDRLIGMGSTIKYDAINVGGTFMNAGTYLETNRRLNIQKISLSRPFVTNELDWSGGLDLQWEQGKYIYLTSGQAITSIPYKLNQQEFWVGRSFPVWFGENVFRQKTKIVVSAGVTNITHTSRPAEAINRNSLFQDYILYLFSAGIINRRYYKDTYIGGFGITEDIPLGGYISFTGGIEKREFSKRWYSGFDAAYSTRINNFGYLSGKLAFGGFRNVNQWEQNAINFNLVYHTPLFRSGNWKFRVLMNNDYLYGFSRFPEEQLYLDAENGVRGISSHALFGTKRVVLNTESLIFSPYSLLGFKLGAMLFADLGLITGKNSAIFQSKLYQGYGAALRVNNESISRANFEVSIVYNPYLPYTSTSDIKIVFTGKLLLGFRMFDYNKPSIIKYNGAR